MVAKRLSYALTGSLRAYAPGNRRKVLRKVFSALLVVKECRIVSWKLTPLVGQAAVLRWQAGKQQLQHRRHIVGWHTGVRGKEVECVVAIVGDQHSSVRSALQTTSTVRQCTATEKRIKLPRKGEGSQILPRACGGLSNTRLARQVPSYGGVAMAKTFCRCFLCDQEGCSTVCLPMKSNAPLLVLNRAVLWCHSLQELCRTQIVLDIEKRCFACVISRSHQGAGHTGE